MTHNTKQSMRSYSLAVALLSFVVLGLLILASNTYAQEQEQDQIFCTMEVKECADGSYVGRQTEMGCEFALCPEEQTPPVRGAVQENRGGQGNQGVGQAVQNQLLPQQTTTQQQIEDRRALRVESRQNTIAAIEEKRAHVEERKMQLLDNREMRKAMLSEQTQTRLKVHVASIEQRIMSAKEKLESARGKLVDYVATIDGTVVENTNISLHLSDMQTYLNALGEDVVDFIDIANAVLASDEPSAGMADIASSIRLLKEDILGAQDAMSNAVDELRDVLAEGE